MKLSENSRLYSPCSCGSGKKYKWCCKDKGEQPLIIKMFTVTGTNDIVVEQYVPTSDNKLKNCLDCGMCCGIDHILNETPQSEIQKLPEEWLRLHPINGKVDMKRHSNGRCILQDQKTNKCSIYNDPRKPSVCSKFRRGSDPRCYTGKLIKTQTVTVDRESNVLNKLNHSQ